MTRYLARAIAEAFEAPSAKDVVVDTLGLVFGIAVIAAVAVFFRAGFF